MTKVRDSVTVDEHPILRASVSRAEQEVEAQRNLAEEALQAFLKAVIQGTPAWMNASVSDLLVAHSTQTKELGTERISVLKRELESKVLLASDLVRTWLDPEPTIWPHRAEYIHNGTLPGYNKYKSLGDTTPPDALVEPFCDASIDYITGLVRDHGWEVVSDFPRGSQGYNQNYRCKAMWGKKLSDLINAYAVAYDKYREAHNDLRLAQKALEQEEVRALWEKA